MTVEASLKPSSQRPWVSLGPHAVPHKPGCLNPEAFFVILALSKKSPGFYDLSTLLPTPSLGCVPGASLWAQGQPPLTLQCPWQLWGYVPPCVAGVELGQGE